MQRHDRVYLRPGAVFQFQCKQADPQLAARVMAWVALGRPLVAARQPADGGGLLLGLTLPAAEGRRRLGCRVAAADVLRVEAPLAIPACLPRLDEARAVPLARLAAVLQAAGVRAGVYGSLAWECLSGEAYRHEQSDIDLICDLASPEALPHCLAALSEAEAALPCGLDGEIRFADGAAVAWKELRAALAGDTAQVLVKSEADVQLLGIDALLARYSREDGMKEGMGEGKQEGEREACDAPV